MRDVFMSFPEVATVVSQLGRPDDGTETTGFFSIEFSVELKPDDQWPARYHQDQRSSSKSMSKLTQRFPGVSFDYSQNIEANIERSDLGRESGENSVKVFGHDLATDERIANRGQGKRSAAFRESSTPSVYRSLGQPNLHDHAGPQRVCALRSQRRRRRRGGAGGDRRPGRRRRCSTAIGASTWSCDGNRSIARASTRSARFASICPAGGQVPLDQVAKIDTAEGASFIYREAFRTLCAGPVCGSRSRSAEHRRRGQEHSRARRQSARRRPSRMGGRVRRTAGRQSPSR